MIPLVFSHQESAKGGTKKRERAASEAEGSTPKPRKKLMKSAEKSEAPPPETFKPFDYSQSDLKVFAGMLDRSPCGTTRAIGAHSMPLTPNQNE